MRPPLLLRREALASPLGEVVILTDGQDRLRAVDFATHDARMGRLLDRHYGREGWRWAEAPRAPKVGAALEAYFAGEVTGYGGGLERKPWLLAHEARHA